MKRLSLDAFKAKVSKDESNVADLVGGILGHCHHVDGAVEGTKAHQGRPQ
ncbi:MAG: hypothetical protein AAFP19_15450 [Bacteroidota bacterium]